MGVGGGDLRRVSFLIPYLNTYRAPFFDLLSDALVAEHIHTEVFVGHQAGEERGRNDVAATGSVTALRQFSLPLGGRSLILRFVPMRIFTCDLVVLEHAPRNLESYPILLFRRLMRKRTAIWGHGHTITKSQSAFNRRIQAWMLRNSDWLFAYTEKSLTRGLLLGADEHRATVVYNTLPPSPQPDARSEPVRVAERVDGDRWNALFVGAIDETKRIDEMIEIARQINQREPSFHLVVAGSGRLQSRLIDAASTSPDLFTYVGVAAPDVKRALAQECQVLFHLGRIGLVAIDSFQLGLPIVSVEWSYHAPEFEYLDSRNSVVVDDLDGVWSAVVSLMHDPARLRQLQQACKMEEARYSMDRMVGEFASGVEGVLNAQPRAWRAH